MALSTMMQQYLSIKEQHPDALLFFRLGDFYEMFFDDAKLASSELELTLTGRDCGLEARAPMCGVPYRAVDTYIARLIEKGYKVAICEQMSDPALTKGLVERDVVRIVTPGTIIDEAALEGKRANYILSVSLRSTRAGLAFCDVSTGDFFLYQIDDAPTRMADELSRLRPSEVIVSDEAEYRTFAGMDPAVVTVRPESDFAQANADAAMRDHFGPDYDMDFAGQRLAISAAGALIRYLTETQKNAMAHILRAKRYNEGRYMALDHIAAQNLELTQTVREGKRRGSLLHTIDRTVTMMGSRLLREWIERPLYDRAAIEARLDAVAECTENPMRLDALREALKPVRDIERLLSRIAYETVQPRDCLMLMQSLQAVPALKASLSTFRAALTTELYAQLDPLKELVDRIDASIDPDTPISPKEGGIFKKGYDPELDQLRDAACNGKVWIAELENRERESTGIKNLKIGYNRVFGYYIEVTKASYGLVPYHYVRRQTLANCERYVTEELKNLERTVLNAEDHAIQREYEMFVALRQVLKTNLLALRRTTDALKCLDVLLSLAQMAQDNEYTRPTLNEEGRYVIVEGRHPVVEEAIGRNAFVPNDTQLNEHDRVMILTGPNMAGKSTYMRQVALIVLLAHIGSFVPAQSADISLTDRICTRIGASDNLSAGQSTFMVEMSEMAHILRRVTRRSLVILDEVGRGTSTFDGLSIAWACVEHMAHPDCGAATLFSTHYHELSVLEGKLDHVVNYRITAKEMGESVIFLRKIVRGGEDRSFGVAVAKLAGLPDAIIARARQIMARLEVDGQPNTSIGERIMADDVKKEASSGTPKDDPARQLIEEIQAIDIMGLSPIEALNRLFVLVEKSRRI